MMIVEVFGIHSQYEVVLLIFVSDPSVKLKEELSKAPCRRYEQNGTCQFAGNCKYRHYTQEELSELVQQSIIFIYFHSYVCILNSFISIVTQQKHMWSFWILPFKAISNHGTVICGHNWNKSSSFKLMRTSMIKLW